MVRALRSLGYTVVFAAVLMLFAVITNIHQPTMDYNVHCSVHDMVVLGFGGECDQMTAGLFANLAFETVFVIFAAAFVCVATAVTLRSELVVVRLHDPAPALVLLDYYSSGAAASRRFV